MPAFIFSLGNKYFQMRISTMQRLYIRSGSQGNKPQNFRAGHWHENCSVLGVETQTQNKEGKKVMKKTSMFISMFAVIAGAQYVLADSGTMGSLAGATEKIATVDMNKNFGMAGSVLNSLFTGAQPQKDTDTAAVDLRASGSRTMEQAVKEVCNAAPAKHTASASKVPAISGEPNKIILSNIPENKMDGWDHTDVYTPVAEAVDSLPNNGTDTAIGAFLGAVGAVAGGAATVGAVVGTAIVGAIGGYVADLENDD